jgi:hypothetical protein
MRGFFVGGKMEDKKKEKQQWDKTANRFVAFFDILGFKEMVSRNSHDAILKKLEQLSETVSDLESHNYSIGMAEIIKSAVGETKAITFSDSIVVYSKGDSLEDLNKIIIDAYWVISSSLEFNIPIKAALSYGQITVDFENSLFFGQPIIDAFLLHEQLQIYAAVLDNHFEEKLATFNLTEKVSRNIHDYKTPFKTGKINHKIIGPPRNKKIVERNIKAVKNISLTVSGGPRIYVDNTLDFLNSILS